jgi:hypothetical protein
LKQFFKDVIIKWFRELCLFTNECCWYWWWRYFKGFWIGLWVKYFL